MEQAKKVIIETFNTNNYIITSSLKNLTDADFFKQPNETTNPIQFLVGHLTHYRYQICNLFGNDTQCPYADLYAMGKKVVEKSAYPSADEIVAEWEKITQVMKSYLENVSPEMLAKETREKYPIGEQNLLGTLQFMLYHESYHVGQIAIVRKFYGYESIIG